MNIFFLYKDSRKAARAQCDKHVVKMCIETTQLLCTAIRYLRGQRLRKNTNKLSCIVQQKCDKKGLYRMTHVNHPMSIWVRASFSNFLWTLLHAKALFEEYTNRYHRIHASSVQIPIIEKLMISTNFTFEPLSVPPQCVANGCRNGGNTWKDTVLAYRNYYKTEKSSFAKWNHSIKPKFMIYLICETNL